LFEVSTIGDWPAAYSEQSMQGEAGMYSIELRRVLGEVLSLMSSAGAAIHG